jgi:hypothetical protein
MFTGTWKEPNNCKRVKKMNELTNIELAFRLRENAEWCDANEWEIPICMGDDQREAARRLEAMEKEHSKVTFDA